MSAPAPGAFRISDGWSPGEKSTLLRAMGGTTGGRLLTIVGNTVSLFKIKIEIKSDTDGFIELLIERRNSYQF